MRGGGSTSPQADQNSRIGTLVGSVYRIVAVIGQGGIGVVYVAEYAASTTRVAIKFLRPEYARNTEIVTRFEREAKAMAGLAHENIVRALDYGRSSQGDVYMVMELAEGETLRAALNRLRAFSLAATLAVARQIGDALVRAHSLGIVHRDLKPENVMIAEAGSAAARIKVLDFGMARVAGGMLADDRPVTQVGAVFGSPSYMPPEQATARPADARADQYALGVMIFEMLAGRRPFESDDPIEIIQMQVNESPPPLSDFAPDAPAAVCAVVERMIAKRPDDRFVSISAAFVALEAAVLDSGAGGASSERAIATVPDHPPLSTRSSRGWWIAGIVALATGLTALGYALVTRL